MVLFLLLAKINLDLALIWNGQKLSWFKPTVYFAPMSFLERAFQTAINAYGHENKMANETHFGIKV